MHDFAAPSPSPDPRSGPAAGDDSTAGAGAGAHQILDTVAAWYTQQLLLARRSGDQRRLKELMAGRQECVADQQRLKDAGPEETARIAAAYADRLKELEGTEARPEA
ncbi:hypothetical protein ACH4PU_31980 [Streptomyces sp. NPDC021100]|uniref:hypothetical protein n=1 Tax=Streptomyces sp. NPDC021100 TaxID=3365114 RepID=UPI0037B0C03C